MGTSIFVLLKSLGKSIGRFMGPMRDLGIVEALHEPEDACLDSEGFTFSRFMVPMHARKRNEAFHELRPLTPSLSPDGGEGEGAVERLALFQRSVGKSHREIFHEAEYDSPSPQGRGPG